MTHNLTKDIKQVTKAVYSNLYSYHPLLSAKPLHKESVLTFLSINFFHSIPSEITRYHSLQTSSAAHRESASRYERILSATWSRPFSATSNKQSSVWGSDHELCFNALSYKMISKLASRWSLNNRFDLWA